MSDQPLDLFTLNYSRYEPAMGTAVQTSNGRPRGNNFKHPLLFSASKIYPPWPLVKGDHPREVFEARYREVLDGRGVDEILSQLRAAVAGGGDPRLVLLCFEDLAKPGWWCHRTMFARWWTEQTGDEVRELGPTGPVDDGQSPLFT